MTKKLKRNRERTRKTPIKLDNKTIKEKTTERNKKKETKKQNERKKGIGRQTSQIKRKKTTDVRSCRQGIGIECCHAMRSGRPWEFNGTPPTWGCKIEQGGYRWI